MMSFQFAAICLLRSLCLVADAGAGGDCHGVAGLVLVDGLGGGNQHLADAALALFERSGVGCRGQDIAGNDGSQVFNLSAAV